MSLASKGSFGVVTFLPALAVFMLSTSSIYSALLLLDTRTIANFRRTNAVLLAGGVLWLICASCGVAYASLSGSATAVTNALVFGAFLCAGSEFLVINGTFTERTLVSVALAAVHPVPTLLILRLSEISSHFDPYPFAFGAGAFAVLGSFTFLLKRRKTSHGFGAIRLFQAFMKTWAGGAPSDLESMIAEHSEVAEITTKVMRFKTGSGDVFVVLPGVHPGPFHPVGSYNLPGLISGAFKDLGPVLTLHRPGGHERNLATGADTSGYVSELHDFARQVQAADATPRMRGPIEITIGNATINSLAVSNDLLATITFSPLGSDDIDAAIETKLQGLAATSGFDMSIVDAHNSLDREQVSLEVDQPAWEGLLHAVDKTGAVPFRVGYSHSKEVDFKGSEDITENGIGLLMFETGASKHVLVLADANNAVPSLRAKTKKVLEASGCRLIEFCTSDSHDLAARGLTVSRGYKALGEATPPNYIAGAVVKMAKLAEARLSACQYGSGKFTKNVRVFGSQALDEFAGVTLASSKLGRAYLRFAVVSIPSLFLLSFLL